jgi:nitrous oxide reductase accessory protein NosL
MSKISKFAFLKKIDAENFINKYGGKIVSFTKALKMAQNSLKSDITLFTKKKKKKMYPMGKNYL